MSKLKKKLILWLDLLSTPAEAPKTLEDVGQDISPLLGSDVFPKAAPKEVSDNVDSRQVGVVDKMIKADDMRHLIQQIQI